MSATNKFLADPLPAKWESKEAYLSWRFQWRECYGQLTMELKNVRLVIATQNRKRLPTGIFYARQRELRAYALAMMLARGVSKDMVRVRMRELGFKAPDRAVRPTPAPRQKKRLTAEEIQALRAAAFEKREARHKSLMASADAHSD